MAKKKITLPKPEGQAPARYFIRYQQKGKFYYKDQNGKRVSAEKVSKAKRKVYQYAQAGPLSGKLIDQKTIKKADTFKNEPPRQVKMNETANVYLTKHAAQAVTQNNAIFIKASGKTFELVTNAARNNLVLFFYELGETFYRKFKKLIDEAGSGFAQFFTPEGKGIKDGFNYWDLDGIELNEQDELLNEFPEAEKTAQKFDKEKNDLIKKYFKI